MDSDSACKMSECNTYFKICISKHILKSELEEENTCQRTAKHTRKHNFVCVELASSIMPLSLNRTMSHVDDQTLACVRMQHFQ